MVRNPFKNVEQTNAVLVIGLGRFGLAVARSLVAMGTEVLAVDEDAARAQRHADELTHVVVADAKDPDALAQLGVGNFKKAVVSAASDVEASVLTAMALVDAGVPDIWAKAGSKEHGKILEKIGVHHVAYPETSMGEQVAHMIVGGMSQYLEFEDDFAIARTMAPVEQWGKTFDETGLRAKYGVTVVGVKRIGQDFIYARPETLVQAHDELVVSGPTKLVETFCTLSSLNEK